MAEIPEHFSKDLAELEARKESLRNRLRLIDSAISDLSPEAAAMESRQLDEAERALAEQEQAASVEHLDAPVRESATTVRPVNPGKPLADPFRDRPVAQKSAESPAETQEPPRRPFPKSTPERRQPGNLNIYVNRHAEWASAQFVAPNSRRAIFRQKTGHRCPSCGSQDTRFTTTKGIADFFMFLFDYSIARCRNCDKRFRIFRGREEEEEQPAKDLAAHPSTE